ncbi:hypothetical protein D3C86_1398560 [compost metagenome]
MHHQRGQVAGGKTQDVLQCLLRLLQLAIVQVQPSQLVAVVGAFGLTFQVLLPGVDGLLQRPEIQTEIVWRKPQQGVHGGVAHALIAIFEQRAQQQAALAVGHQGADAVDRRNAHVRRFMLQVRSRQFQRDGAGVVGQFGMQPDTSFR